MDEAHIRTHRQTLLALAAESISHGLRQGRPIDVDLAAHPEELHIPGACFVTLKLCGELRGCIGTASAWRPLVADVAANAFAAAFEDPRFPPLAAVEHAEVSLSLSVLTPPAAMDVGGEADLLRKLRPRIDGLIIEAWGRRALFLPAVWEQLPEPHTFLAQLKRKAGLGYGEAEGLKAWRFQAVELSSED